MDTALDVDKDDMDRVATTAEGAFDGVKVAVSGISKTQPNNHKMRDSKISSLNCFILLSPSVGLCEAPCKGRP